MEENLNNINSVEIIFDILNFDGINEVCVPRIYNKIQKSGVMNSLEEESDNTCVS